MARKRSPQQTMMAAMAVLLGVWLMMFIYKEVKDDRLQELPAELPDLEYVDLSPDELYAQPGFKPHEGGPKTWDHISLRMYAGEAGTYTRFLRCTIDADEVERTNRDAFRDDMHRMREPNEGPPPWWPGLAQDETNAAVATDAGTDPVMNPWTVPSWWAPGTEGIGTWWTVPDGDTYIGVYLHYEPETRLMHVWEWRRMQDEVTPPEHLYGVAVADAIASGLSQLLVDQGHPAVFGDWLHAPDFDPAPLKPRIYGLPDELRSIDGLFRPLERMRYLMVLRGLSRDQAELILGEVPMREGEADSPPPADWDFARPKELPAWWSPGPGPRWHYTLARPGSGIIEEARWASWDESKQALYIWDWRGK
ncbi:MAG: hypothetical protein PF961_00680 [Planctomycetota bacterium]|jgi:hypothetical protein|nr:hypothetical protein [Planctomycetota bacterium]